MPRLFNATCEDGVVKVSGHTVACEIMSQGTAASTGILILDGETAKYVTLQAADLAETISQLSSILSSIASILTSIDGGLTVPGTNAGAISALSALNSTLGDLGENLK